MTGENKKKNVDEELDRSEACLEEARVLERNGLYSGAVSRLYYSVLHGIRALLLSKGLEPKSHEGALNLLNLHFVKDGIVDREISKSFARLMKFREEADYSASFEFTREDYLQFQKDADRVLADIRIYLRQQKFTE
jgi:uncharacterized protein (UPF0332 family)